MLGQTRVKPKGGSGFRIGEVHYLCHLEVQPSDHTVSEVGSQFDIEGLTAVGDTPLRVVVPGFSVPRHTHDVSLALLEGGELKDLGHGVEISVPSIGASTGHDILDNVLVHLLKL